MDHFVQDALKIVLLSLCFVTLNCLLIILGSRYGWFLWALKKILKLRSKRQQQEIGTSGSKKEE